MKYEAPLCELVKINDLDIIRTSPDNDDGTDTPFVDVGISIGG